MILFVIECRFSIGRASPNLSASGHSTDERALIYDLHRRQRHVANFIATARDQAPAACAGFQGHERISRQRLDYGGYIVGLGTHVDLARDDVAGSGRGPLPHGVTYQAQCRAPFEAEDPTKQICP